VGYARAGFNQLSEVVENGPAVTPASAQTPQAELSPRPPSIEIPVYDRAKPPRSAMPLMLIIVAVIVVAIGAAAYMFFGRSTYDKEMAAGIDAMKNAQTEAARSDFQKVVRDHPDKAEPHVFLARLARTDGDLPTAHRELSSAIQLEPNNAQALREMGLLLLAENNLSLASNFFVRAIKADTSDAASKGYLGCALIKQNRIVEGQKFLSRAGPGSWASCATATTPPL